MARPHVLDALNRVRGPFNLNGAAQAAGVASLEDVAHIERAIAHNSRWLPWLSRGDRGAWDRGDAERRKFSAPELSRRNPAGPPRTRTHFLSARGFILRAVAAYGLPDCLRLTVGGEEANRGVVAALAEFMRGEGD